MKVIATYRIQQDLKLHNITNIYDIFVTWDKYCHELILIFMPENVIVTIQ